jgi:hypothetical protein
MAKVELLAYVNEPSELEFKDIKRDWETAIKHPQAKVAIVDVELDGEKMGFCVLYNETDGVATEDEVAAELAEEIESM